VTVGGPNGCTCGRNGDRNCPFVASEASERTRTITTVANIHRDRALIAAAKAAGTYVYIGRGQGSIWGNPFTHIKEGTLAKFVVPYDQVLARYEQHVRSSPDMMKRIGTLRGKLLGCFCKPKPCHGDVLVRLVAELCR
jgi:hypothetical protein